MLDPSRVLGGSVGGAGTWTISYGNGLDFIVGGTEGAVQQGPVRVRVLETCQLKEKERYKADIRATNILLQGIPKDIYSLINHYTDAKDIWENVKMILEGSELIKDERESQLYDEFEHFRQIKGETIQGYYVRTMMERFLQPTNDPLALVSNASVQQYSTQSSKSPQSSNETSPTDNFQLDSGSSSTENLIESLSNSLAILTQSYKSHLPQTNLSKTSPIHVNKATVQDGRVVVQDVRGRYNANNQGKPFQRNNARGNVVAGNENRLPTLMRMWIIHPENDLALNVDHIFEADECDAFDSDVDEGPTSQTMFMANLTSEDPIYDEVGPSYDSNTPFEVQDHDTFVDHLDEYQEVHEMQSDSKTEEVTILKKDFKQKEDKFLEEFLGIKRPKRIVMSNHARPVVHDSEDTREIAEITRKRMLLKMQSPLCVENKVRIAPPPPDYSKENLLATFAPQRNLTPEQIFWSIDDNDRKKAETSVPKPISALTVYPPNTPVKLVPRVLPTKSQSLKAQLRSKVSCFTSDSVKPKVLAPGMYAIDVKPIPHPLKNNRSAHLNYISHLKESVETVREIVEEARVVKPLDNALNYACQYTKLSQELKKQVTFSDKPGTSSSNTQKHEAHQKVQQTNIPVIPSTGVNASTEASGSKPRSNTKKNRILPAKKENMKKVEVHLRTNKSVWTKVNRIDSSISYKRVVINSNSESVCKMCDKCLNSANHEKCVVNILSSVNANPTVKRVLNKGKQIWKPKGKLSDNRLNKTKRVWKETGKLFADIGYQWRPTGKKFTLGKLDCGYQWRPTGKNFALGEMFPLTKLSVKCCSKHMTGNRSKLKNFVEKFIGTVRFGNDHFGAIMGYGDYVIGDSVISRVYYVEGLGHNLFFVGQFCDSDLEVAFRKHTCFVRDINGADLLKGSRSTNLYTISIDDMMKSSPICLLSKASKSKSWLWHRRLNHLNFSTINDLARKDLVRGTDISKIIRKPSKTGKHGHEERKSTKEARDAKPKAGKVKKSKLWSTLGQFSVNKSQP
ncbi:integrase, catalytic region, zinc finger, CCHC-type containing protein [Tanacetum coccineum]